MTKSSILVAALTATLAGTIVSAQVDPSVAKARAAGVDTKVFGFALGEPLALPICETLQSQRCQLKTWPDGTIPIVLSANDDHPWMIEPLYAYTLNGNLVRVQFDGHWDDEGFVKASADLSAKYGKPQRTAPVKFQNDLGATFNRTDLHWSLPGLHVDLEHLSDSAFKVHIELESSRQTRTLKKASEDAKKPKL